MNEADYRTLLARAAAAPGTPSLSTAVEALRTCLKEIQGTPARTQEHNGLVAIMSEAIPPNPSRRADLPQLMESIIWPLRLPDGTTTPTPFHLSLDKEDLIRRLWKADGAHDDDTYTEFSEYRIIFYVALHSRPDFAPYRAHIPALLEQVYAFSEAQITTDAERLLMISASAAYFAASRATHAVPAPAPYTAFDSGNAPGLTGNTQPGQNS